MNVPAGVASDDPILQLPKVSLHDHLDGGLRPETMIELADRIGHTLPADDAESLRRWFSESANSGDLVRYLETFSHTVALMQDREGLRRVAKERSEEHTSELQSRGHLVCRLLLEKKKNEKDDSVGA